MTLSLGIFGWHDIEQLLDGCLLLPCHRNRFVGRWAVWVELVLKQLIIINTTAVWAFDDNIRRHHDRHLFGLIKVWTMFYLPLEMVFNRLVLHGCHLITAVNQRLHSIVVYSGPEHQQIFISECSRNDVWSWASRLRLLCRLQGTRFNRTMGVTFHRFCVQIDWWRHEEANVLNVSWRLNNRVWPLQSADVWGRHQTCDLSYWMRPIHHRSGNLALALLHGIWLSRDQHCQAFGSILNLDIHGHQRHLFRNFKFFAELIHQVRLQQQMVVLFIARTS